MRKTGDSVLPAELAALTGRTLAEAFEDSAGRHGDARLIVATQYGEAEHRLADLVLAGNHLSGALAGMGIGEGDTIALQLPGRAEWMIAAVAAARLGAVLLPIVSIYGPRELRLILGRSRAKVIIAPATWRGVDYRERLTACGPLPDLAPPILIGDASGAGPRWESLLSGNNPIPDAVRRSPDAPAMLVFTSGTTAEPKGVLHSSRTLLAEIASMHAMRAHLADEVSFSPWPPGHIAGAVFMLRYLIHGVPLVLMDHWNADHAASLIARHHASAAAFTPYHLNSLLDAAESGGHDISYLRDSVVGAAPVPSGLIARCAAHGIATYRAYGSSEHPTVTSGRSDDPVEKRLGTEGRPVHGSEIRFVDDAGEDVPDGADGEITVRGPERFLGYLDPGQEEGCFLPGGWFRTGDIGRLDPDGYLLITDRKKDVIIRGGENISSREVEAVLFAHPDIADSAVVAMPDARMGEVVCAFVVPRPGAAVTLDAIRMWFVSAGIARQKTPEHLILIDALPRNGVGKVLKQELRARARADAAPAAQS